MNSAEQGVTQGCSLSPILFSVLINELLSEVEQAELNGGGKIGSPDDFVGVTESEGKLQELINVVLTLYKTFGKVVEFKKYLHGPGDAGLRLLFKFRSETHGLNEELGRHCGREGMKECLLCGDECESVSHVLWECPAYNICKSDFTANRIFLGKGFRISSLLIVRESLPLCWGRKTFHHSLSLLGVCFAYLGAKKS